MRNSAHFLLELINDILDFSKIEAGKMDLELIGFSLRDSISEAMKTLNFRAVEKGLELACRIQPETPDMLVGDPGRIRQVITNLVGNAIKFTEEGEVIVNVELSSEEGSDAILHFSVRDTGIGIPQEQQEKIFEKFSQADGSTTRKYGGTGLGLAICMQLVELMNGLIWVESVDGEGSTFHFTARFGVQAEGHVHRDAPDVESLQGLSVLVVDDNDTNRQILSEMVKSWGMMPTTAEDAKRALGVLWSSDEPFALVLMDGMMPGMDGFDLAEQIRQNEEWSRHQNAHAHLRRPARRRRALPATRHRRLPHQAGELAGSARGHPLGDGGRRPRPGFESGDTPQRAGEATRAARPAGRRQRG